MIEQVLLIAGASIFGVLGTLHLIFTFFTNKFDAYDSSVTEAMKNTSPVLTKDTTVWDAWIGFNASHSSRPRPITTVLLIISTMSIPGPVGSATKSRIPAIISVAVAGRRGLLFPGSRVLRRSVAVPNVAPFR